MVSFAGCWAAADRIKNKEDRYTLIVFDMIIRFGKINAAAPDAGSKTLCQGEEKRSQSGLSFGRRDHDLRKAGRERVLFKAKNI